MIRLLSFVLLALAASQTNAALLGRAPLTPGGTDYQAYYDDVLDITWVADANLPKTMATDPSDLGLMFPEAAQSWIESLNALGAGGGYLGANNWRLPIVVDTTAAWQYCGYFYFDFSGTACGYNVLTKSGALDQFEPGQTVYSELAHMFYVTLGNSSPYDTTGAYVGPTAVFNTGPFANLEPFFYWSGSNSGPGGTANRWFFRFGDGWQHWDSGEYLVWAVHDGDIALVPIPAAVWLFASALGGLAWLRRR